MSILRVLVIKSVVFIMGAGHCGSTLLDLILGSHSRGFSLAEFRVIGRLLAEEGDSLPGKVCVICPDRCAFWHESVSFRDVKRFYSKKTLAQKLGGKLARQFRNPYDFLFAAAGKSMLVDSSKTLGWIRRQLNPPRVWKDVIPRLIYLKRDGRAVVNSYLRKYPERGLDAITETWVRNVSAYNDYFERYPFASKTIVHYEELAQHPESCTKRICGFLDIAFEKEMLLYWKHDHHPIAGNGGTQSLILRYREQYGESAQQYRTTMNAGDRYYESKYYDDVGLAIRFDERWKRELTSDQISRFDSIAGELNRDCAIAD